MKTVHDPQGRNRRSVIDQQQGQRGLEHLFGIKDPQSYPDVIDLTGVQPVVDMAMGGHARMIDNSKWLFAEQLGSAVAGQNFTRTLLSYGNASGADPQIVVPLNHNFVLWGVNFQINLTAGGAAAMAGKKLASNCTMNFGAARTCEKWWGQWGPIAASAPMLFDGTEGSLKLTREHIYVVPAGCGLSWTTWVQDGTFFHVAVTVTYRVMGLAVPVGAPLPLWV